jgi:hypothetical protein
MSVIDTRLQRCEQRISEANTSFIAERSSVKRGMTLVRRRSSSKLRSIRLVVRQKMGDGPVGAGAPAARRGPR